MSNKNNNNYKESGNNKGKKKKSYNNQKNVKHSNYHKNDTTSVEGLKIKDFDAIKSNDINWYNKNPIQFKLATQVPAWAQIQGSKYPTGTTLPIHNKEHTSGYFPDDVIPGVMTITWLPSIGISRDANSPVNKAFNRLMSELYARTSGASLQFQQADLAMMITSLSSLGCLFAHIKRILGVKDFWVTRNINYPRLLARALGCPDYDDLVRNYNSYVSRLNNLISIYNSIKIPSWFDIFARQYSMSKNIYMDEDSDLGQIFVYVPEGVWDYDDEDGACYLYPLEVINKENLGQWLDDLDYLLSRWMNSSDLYLINGALLRAFGDSHTIFIEPFNPGEYIKPIVDENMSMQLMNCTIIGSTFNSVIAQGGWSITQNPATNALIFDPRSEEDTPIHEYVPDGMICRAFKDMPTAEDNMEMTRLAVAGYMRERKSPIITACGTEVVFSIYAFKGYGPIDDLDFSYVLRSNVINVDYGEAYPATEPLHDLIQLLRFMSTFRYLPRIVIEGWVPNGDSQFCSDVFDMYNYSYLSLEDLERLHETALYSIWKPALS